MPPYHEQEGGSATHERIVDEIVQQMQTDGLIGDATRRLQKGGEIFSNGVKKFSNHVTESWKLAMLDSYNMREMRLTSRETRHMEKLRLWMYHLKIADLEKADQDGTLTPEERRYKQKRIKRMKDEWQL